MTKTGDNLDPSTETEDLVTPAVTGEEDEDDLDEEENLDEDQDDDQDDDEDGEPEKPQKDYKQKFNSAMSNIRKLTKEVEDLKSSKKGGTDNISEEDMDKLREKYDEEDLEIITKVVNKQINDNDSSKLAQKEENIFLKKFPETSGPQLKQLKFMQKEFGYSLEYAHEITFGEGKKAKPQDHSINTGTGGEPKKKAKAETEDEAFKAMQQHYGA